MEADREYQSLLGYKDRIDFKINYAQFLVEQQRYAEAVPLLTEFLRSHSLMNRAAQRYNQHWKQQANRLLEVIEQYK